MAIYMNLLMEVGPYTITTVPDRRSFVPFYHVAFPTPKAFLNHVIKFYCLTLAWFQYVRLILINTLHLIWVTHSTGLLLNSPPYR